MAEAAFFGSIGGPISSDPLGEVTCAYFNTFLVDAALDFSLLGLFRPQPGFMRPVKYYV